MFIADYKILVDSLYDGVYFVDSERRITFWNKAAERLTGYTAEEVQNHFCHNNILDHIDSEGNQLCQGGCPLAKTLNDGKLRERDVFLRHKRGHRMPVSVRVSPVRDSEGNIIGAIEVFSDNSAKMSAIQQLKQLKDEMLLDHLTGLCNRKSLESYLDSKLTDLYRHSWAFGINFIDIDDFKRVNDTYGHDVGDDVLKMIAQNLLSNSRSFDITGRWGGDEFISIMSHVDESQMRLISERFKIMVEKSEVDLNGEKLKITVSIGATIARAGDTVESLIKRADELLYQSKHEGRNKVSFG